MAEVNLLNGLPSDAWARLAPDLSLTQLDHLKRDGVNIQCLNSSDFVIGKQTNFNGPVTIITCAEVLRESQGKKTEEDKRENLVIKEKILSQSAAMKMQKLAVEKTERGGHRGVPGGHLEFEKFKKAPWIFGLVSVGLLVAAFIAFAALPASFTEKPLPKCTLLSNNTCIFSEFDWGGRRTSNPLKPLRTPVSHVIISQTYNDFCYEAPACLDVMKWLQLNTTDETACSFFIGGDGNAYEDRGCSWESSLKGPAKRSAIQICLMGNFSDEEYPTYPQMTTALALVRFGIESDCISKDYVLAASNATSSQQYLGSIYRIIKRWPNFSEEPFSQRNSSLF